MVKFHFSCLHPYKSVFSIAPRIFGCTCFIHDLSPSLDNCLLDLSNVSLSNIPKLRKNIDATIHLSESILCLLMFHFESVPYFSLDCPGTSSPSVPHPPPVLLSTPIPTLDASLLVSQADTTEPPASRPLRVVTRQYTRRPKVLAPQSVSADSSPVEGPSPPLSITPSDLDVHIALQKSKWSCTDHLISNFVSYDRLTTSFSQFAMCLTSVLYIHT